MSILATELEWPEGTKFFEVQCRLGIWDIDGWDADKAPEVKALGGTVRITPRTPTGRIRILEPDGKYRVVVATPLTFNIDEYTGKLVNTADNTEGVWVVDPSSKTIDPKGFTYSAVVTPQVGSPFTVEFDGSVAIDGVYDLANGATVVPSKGVTALDSRIAKLEAEPFQRGTNPARDVTTLEPGYWNFTSTSQVALSPGLPETNPGVLHVIGNTGVALKTLVYYPYRSAHFWTLSRHTATTWGEWVKHDPTTVDLDPSALPPTLNRGALDDSMTLDSLDNPNLNGLWGFSSKHPSPRPFASGGSILVFANAGSYGSVQIISSGASGQASMRVKTAGGWSPWVPLEAEPFQRGTNPARDVTTLEPGYWNFTSTSQVALSPGLPETNPGVLHVIGNTGVALKTLVYYPYRSAHFWTLSRHTATTWGEWVKHDPTTVDLDPSTLPDLHTRHVMLRQDFSQRVGPVVVSTPAAVALRFDHGLNNFRDHILPILREFGLPSTQVMNSRNWSRAESNGVTPDEADKWSDVEFVNHGATHADAPTSDGQYDEIVNGLTELQAQLPGHRIDGWAFPGVRGTNYGGLNAGNPVTAFADTYAGRLIVGHHAYVEGHASGTQLRPLDGVERFGQRHYTYEAFDLAKFQKTVRDAQTAKAGIVMMMHPSLLNTSGNVDTATLRSMLEWLAAERDAGRVEVLTMGQLSLAERVDPGSWASGPRNIASMLPHTSSTFGVTLERVGGMVTLGLFARQFDLAGASTGDLLLTLPAGFRPSSAYRAPVTSHPSAQIEVASSGQVKLMGGKIEQGSYVSFHLSHLTTDNIPSILPGL